MIAHAKATYVRMSARKVRYVIDLVRKKNVRSAYSILDRTSRRASVVVKKLIQSAVDSAVKNKNESLNNLFISKIIADEAGMMKRWRAMSMGRAGMIRKRLSHVIVELDQIKKNGSAVDSGLEAKALTKEDPKAAKNKAKTKRLAGRKS